MVHKIAPDAQIILYGSRARGDAELDSDYDLLVLVKQPLTRQLDKDICYTLYDLERETDTVICIQIYEQAEWLSPKLQVTPFVINVEREGILI
ncbi:MAG: nucleotidyltransferase domain-containing protein [Candidatus Schekmanbacteria bacterium]|nr:nucleotidyltransferase domain-containing protein [Candidatus Schekmanbacteria bacterium]